MSHRSAAGLWGIAKPLHPVDVTAPVGWQGPRRRSGIWIHRCRLPAEQREIRSEIPVTTVARTLFDFAEVVNFQRLRSAWEEADRLRLLSLGEVEQVCELGFGRRALRPIRRLLAESNVPDLTRSALEDLFIGFCREYGLQPP
ncbi:MAG TPA: hypothetical protein VNM87_10135, partial [Candidatus Udaeobacter sp.]|nr:hypothetical protein [Candidatus Udaeobacter sp.]